MKTFKQYISEIFDSSKIYTSKDIHPDLVPEESDNDTLTYIFTPRDAKYNPIRERQIRTVFMRTGNQGNEWDMEFTIGGKYQNPAAGQFPEEATKKIFDHSKHFMDLHREAQGTLPRIVYGTTHPRKHRLFQAIAKKLGVEATNKLKVSDSPIEGEE